MKKQWDTIFSHLRLTFIKRKNRIRLTESSFSLWLSNITHIMSKSLALCSEGGNFAKHTDKRSGGCEGEVKEKNSGESEAIADVKTNSYIDKLSIQVQISHLTSFLTNP